MDPRTTLTAFDRYLADHGQRGDLVVIGGTALALLGIISRPTRDCDVLEPPLGSELLDLARRFASEQTQAGMPLDQEWLNNGPASLVQVLPVGWRKRLTLLSSGRGLVLRTLGRSDLLATKIWALCDRGTDFRDCIAMAPTADEITVLRPWLHDQDANPNWPAHVDAVLTNLALRCGHGL